MPRKLNQPPLELTGPEYVALIGNAERRILASSVMEKKEIESGSYDVIDYLDMVINHEMEARAHLRKYMCDNVAVEHLPRALNLFDNVSVNPGILIAMLVTGDIVITGLDEAIELLPQLNALMKIHSKGEYGL